MAPAARKFCDYPGCSKGGKDGSGNPLPYQTEEGIPTREGVKEDLNNHVRMAHELPLKHKEAAAEELRAEADKLRAEAAKLAAEKSTGVEGTGVRGQGSARTIVDKRAAIPRPSIDEGVTESDWSFFAAQWTRYKTSTDLSGVAEVQPE